MAATGTADRTYQHRDGCPEIGFLLSRFFLACLTVAPHQSSHNHTLSFFARRRRPGAAGGQLLAVDPVAGCQVPRCRQRSLGRRL